MQVREVREHARELPTGTVTFLFTDIEGSTRLLQRVGPLYREVLEEHNHLIRRGVGDWDGVVVHTEGDSFFVAFDRAPARHVCLCRVWFGGRRETWGSARHSGIADWRL